jgi:predicted secreted Zn-dependent protease
VEFRIVLSLVGTLILLPAVDDAAAQSRPPPIQPGHHVRYYDVSGLTLETLERSLDQHAPTGPNGIRAYGLTEWEISWNYFPWKRRNDCKLLYISTSLRTTITLPKWPDSEDASPALVGRWDAFIEALEDHENGHLENARAAERAIADALSNASSAATCGAAARAADQAALDVVWRYRSLDQKYDRDTRYGRDQFEAILARE